MLQEPALRQLLQMSEHEMPELAEVRFRLDNITPEEARLLVRKWRDLACCNKNFVEFVDVLTAALGCNTAPYFLGGGEAAKAAMFYMIKYARSQSPLVPSVPPTVPVRRRQAYAAGLA